MTPALRAEKIAALQRLAADCVLCPRSCRVNRLQGEKGRCGAAGQTLISSAGPHFGEEKELVGRGGSGTIFFVNCNLECVFCQNWTISRAHDSGRAVTTAELASLMLSLQEDRCSNINLVTPTPYLHQIASAIDLAASKGLTLPVVYNCGGYESVQSLRLLEGFIDIYMPDAKYGSDSSGRLYSGVPDYYTRLKESLKEMQRQVGDLKTDSSGLAYAGLLVRHLVMPENIAGSSEIARFLSEEISPRCAVNVMAQYYPSYRAGEYKPLTRRITSAEFLAARDAFADRNLRLL
ncbi:MAG: radical SAM protein [Firmicutes bacterium]|nr:radical SAM protein [Bacillota bacterium]